MAEVMRVLAGKVLLTHPESHPSRWPQSDLPLVAHSEFSCVKEAHEYHQQYAVHPASSAAENREKLREPQEAGDKTRTSLKEASITLASLAK